MLEQLTHAIASLWGDYRWFLLIVAIGMLLERIRPAQRNQPLRHAAFNIVWTALYVVVIYLTVPPLMALTRPLIERYGLHIPIDFPPGIGWEILRALVFLAIYDFFYYWLHRAQHVFPALWAAHKMHHSDFSLNVTTNNRHHWLEEPIRVFAILLPMGLLFDIRPSAIIWIAIATMVWAYFIHANLRLSLGPLTPVIAGPQLHRIHHSDQIEHRDRNFAAFFPIYDVLFGTYYRPKPDEYPTTGTDDGEDLNGFLRASASPFVVWGRMLAAGYRRVMGRRGNRVA